MDSFGVVDPFCPGSCSMSLLEVSLLFSPFGFGSTSEKLAHIFSEHMKNQFEMSMMGEWNYFIGLQVKEMDQGSLSLSPNMLET